MADSVVVWLKIRKNDIGETIKPKAKIKENTTIGIDLGIKNFIVASDGKEFDNPKFLRKAQSKLKYVQRKYSKYKGKRQGWVFIWMP